MSPLHVLGDLIRSTLAQVPLGVVRAMFVAIPLILMVWVLRMPTSETTPPNSPARWNQDLRIWAWLTLAMQVLIYCL